MAGINITWSISQSVDDSKIIKLLRKYGCNEEKTTAPHQKWVCKGTDVIIQRFERNVLVQGNESEQNLQLLKELSKIEGLSLDKPNREKFVKFFTIHPNAILCMECYELSMLIKGESNDLNIQFRRECGHVIDMHPPIFMVTNRLLPDVNVLVAGLQSKLIRLNYLEGFEIVIPHFVFAVIDTLGRVEKGKALHEIESLRNFERDGKIALFNCQDGYLLPKREEFQQEEDDIILKIARLTNSILFTGDEVLMGKALASNRPTIYIHPKDSKKIHIMTEVRNPIK